MAIVGASLSAEAQSTKPDTVSTQNKIAQTADTIKTANLPPRKKINLDSVQSTVLEKEKSKKIR